MSENPSVPAAAAGAGASSAPAGTIRLTVAQALVRFLAAQHSERDGVRHRLIPGTFGIFGHGNVAGVGQALLQNALAPAPAEAGATVAAAVPAEAEMPYYQARNEQNMVHTVCRPWHAPLRSARARRTWSPARRWRPSTGSPC